MKKCFTVSMEIEAQSEEAVSSMLERTFSDSRVLSFEIVPEDEEKKARIAYDKEGDMFKLMLSTDGGNTWDFSTGVKCKHCCNDPDPEPMYIHVGLVEALKNAILCGFKVIY